jgi:hypothetical protein
LAKTEPLFQSAIKASKSHAFSNFFDVHHAIRRVRFALQYPRQTAYINVLKRKKIVPFHELPKRNPIFSPEIVTFPRALQENTQPPNVDNWDCWSKIWLAGCPLATSKSRRSPSHHMSSSPSFQPPLTSQPTRVVTLITLSSSRSLLPFAAPFTSRLIHVAAPVTSQPSHTSSRASRHAHHFEQQPAPFSQPQLTHSPQPHSSSRPPRFESRRCPTSRRGTHYSRRGTHYSRHMSSHVATQLTSQPSHMSSPSSSSSLIAPSPTPAHAPHALSHVAAPLHVTGPIIHVT